MTHVSYQGTLHKAQLGDATEYTPNTAYIYMEDRHWNSLQLCFTSPEDMRELAVALEKMANELEEAASHE